MRLSSYESIWRVLTPLERSAKQRFQPAKPHLIRGSLANISRSKSELIAQNAFLRQQLIVLQRQSRRPVLTPRDHTILVLLASRFSTWRHKSKVRTQQSRVPQDVITLIHSMARDNRLWGSKRIRDELRKLGYCLSKRTVAKYIRQVRHLPPPRRPSQTWCSFLNNHAHDIWACDFLQTYDLWFRTLFVFFFIELGSRCIVHFSVICHSIDTWVAQQLREATSFDTRLRFLIRDNDRKYGTEFERASSGIEILCTPIRAPKANAGCERFLGSVRRECLDHIVVVNERHLHRVIKEYVAYFNMARPHQGIAGQVPIPLTSSAPETDCHSKIVSVSMLGGLHHGYRRGA